MKTVILKVSSKSDSSKLAGAIVGMMKENQRVELTAVGAGAVNQAIKAVATARGFVAPTGIDLVCIPAFTEVSFENETRTGMRIIIKEEK